MWIGNLFLFFPKRLADFSEPYYRMEVPFEFFGWHFFFLKRGVMSRRFKPKPPIKWNIWKADGKFWYADKVDIASAISRSKRSDADIRARLGAGYCHLVEALHGKRLDGWSVVHVEWGLTPESDLQPNQMHSWPPLKAREP